MKNVRIIIYLRNTDILFFYFLAHYRPVEPSKQSFIYNAAGKWI